MFFLVNCLSCTYRLGPNEFSIQAETMDPSPDILRSMTLYSSGSTTMKGSLFSVSQINMFTSLHQTDINLPSISQVSNQSEPLDGVWRDALQMPVTMSQILTTPSESLEIVTPSCACRVIDLIGAEVGDMAFGSAQLGLLVGNQCARI